MQYESAQQVFTGGVADVERRFMSSVYRWMTLGMLVTAAVAWYVDSTPAALHAILASRALFFGLIIAQFGLVVVLSMAVQKLSAPSAGALFLLYSALTGVTFSIVLLAYTGGTVVTALAATAGTFAAMSLYGTVTKRNLDGWGSFLWIGLIGVIIASVINLFVHSPMLDWVISAAAVVVFTGLTAWDTQKLRRMARAGMGDQVAALPINGALMLYLDFINLFLALLQIFGGRD